VCSWHDIIPIGVLNLVEVSSANKADSMTMSGVLSGDRNKVLANQSMIFDQGSAGWFTVAQQKEEGKKML
jgi:hypothetical protein